MHIHGNTECTKLLLSHKDIKVQFDSEAGFAELHFVCAAGLVERLKTLTDKEISDVNLKDSEGYTPLHYSAQNGKTECLRIFLLKKLSMLMLLTRITKSCCIELLSIITHNVLNY